MSESKKQVHITVYGKVQGVFFRHYTRLQAEEFKLTGWVKNTADGNVEILAEGFEKELLRLIEWCHRGSPTARVEKVDIDYQPPTNAFEDFQVLY
jgi:acylphosphatase